MAFKKGQTRPPGAGRKPNSPNKLTKALKEMVLGALDDAGGQEYLRQQAVENPGAFMTLLGKVLPTTLSGDPEAPLIPDHAAIDQRILVLLVKAGMSEDEARLAIDAQPE